MKMITLSSGSRGNATLIYTTEGIILIDFGLKIREFTSKLKELDINIDDILFVLITHSHTDHLINSSLILNLFPPEKIYSLPYTVSGANILTPFVSFDHGDLKIMPIPLSHDVPCVGFIIVDKEEKLVYISDTGYINSKLYDLLSGSNHIMIECNHDYISLYKSNRPQHLIQRIISSKGHLSNEECGQCLINIVTNQTKSITLLHLSEEANSPDLALNVIKNLLNENGFDLTNIELIAADRFGISKINPIKEVV